MNCLSCIHASDKKRILTIGRRRLPCPGRNRGSEARDPNAARLEMLLMGTPQDHAGTLIVGELLKEDVFDLAWNHPRVLEAVRLLLGPDPRLLGFASRGLRPGHGQQALHVDWAGRVCPAFGMRVTQFAPWSTSRHRTVPRVWSRVASQSLDASRSYRSEETASSREAPHRFGGNGLYPQHSLRPFGRS